MTTLSNPRIDAIPAADLDRIKRMAELAADSALLRQDLPTLTGAERTRLVVEAVIESLIGNGYLTVSPSAQWEELFVVNAPYISEF